MQIYEQCLYVTEVYRLRLCGQYILLDARFIFFHLANMDTQSEWVTKRRKQTKVTGFEITLLKTRYRCFNQGFLKCKVRVKSNLDTLLHYADKSPAARAFPTRLSIIMDLMVV